MVESHLCQHSPVVLPVCFLRADAVEIFTRSAADRENPNVIYARFFCMSRKQLRAGLGETFSAELTVLQMTRLHLLIVQSLNFNDRQKPNFNIECRLARLNRFLHLLCGPLKIP